MSVLVSSTDMSKVRLACDVFVSSQRKVNVRDRCKEQARDGRGALEKLSFIDQDRERIQTPEREERRENATE